MVITSGDLENDGAREIREIDVPDADVSRVREELRHAFWERLADADPHAICLVRRYGPDNRQLDFKVVGCSCGWEIPQETENPDDDISRHVTITRVRAGRTPRPTPPPDWSRHHAREESER